VKEVAWRTAGERLCNRELRKEQRAGVPHFVEGQHHAEILDADGPLLVSLTWVDQFGHAVFMVVERRGDEWVGRVARKAGQSYCHSPINVKEDYKFSEPQLEALNGVLKEIDGDQNQQR
jgi:hypothetical protein